jgi:hypothetical protein
MRENKDASENKTEEELDTVQQLSNPSLGLLNHLNEEKGESNMRTIESRHVLGLVAAGASFWSLPAQATLTPQCSGFYERAYNAGVGTGHSIVSQAWAGVEEDCERLEEFETIIMGNVLEYRLSPGAGQYTVCRYLGHVEGMLQAIENTYAQCQDQCCMGRSLIGEISGVLYCQMSHLTGGLDDVFDRQPRGFCGPVFWFCCGFSFSNVTYNYVDFAYDDPETENFNEGECKRFTDQGELDPETGEPRWEEIWNQVRGIQCGHELYCGENG